MVYDPARLVSVDFPDAVRGFQILYYDYYLRFDHWSPERTVWEDLLSGLLLLPALINTPPPNGPGNQSFDFGILRGNVFLARGEIGRVAPEENRETLEGKGAVVLDVKSRCHSGGSKSDGSSDLTTF